VLVVKERLADVCKHFEKDGAYGLDTETTGLRVYSGDRLFSLILSDHDGAYYFNFQQYPDIDDCFVLDREETFKLLTPAFSNPETTWYVANAKFDMGMLAREGAYLSGTVRDTEVSGRLIFNKHFQYGLAASAERVGLEKSQEVDDYIKKNRLYSWLKAPGKTKKAKQPHYDRVPFEIIAPYGETDGTIVRQIGENHAQQLEELAKIGGDKFKTLMENEWRLTKTCFTMEQCGIKIDRAYCEEARQHELSRAEQAAQAFQDQSGIEFKDSNKVLAEAFDQAGEDYPTTDKGNPSFKDTVLAGFSSPLAKLVQTHRDATKKANTYYANFLYYADESNLVHANIRQAGTDTGRFSYSDPNLQNLSKEENLDQKYLIRRAFIPRPSYFFAMLDYSQQEYRMLLDYAGEFDVISKINQEGLDVHQATASLMGVDRTSAKTLNFMLLYGGGAQKLAASLGLPLEKALQLRYRYFSQLPKIKGLIRRVIKKAESEPIKNWAGRRYHFDQGFAYKAPNHLIQGGCADVLRFALNKIHDFLEDKESRLLVTVHDEILCEIAFGEEHLIPDIKNIMENTYPHKYLQLTCDVDYSLKSWGDKRPWNLEECRASQNMK